MKKVYGLDTESGDFMPLTGLLLLEEEEVQGVEDFRDLMARYGGRVVDLENPPPLPEGHYIRLLQTALKEKELGDRLLKASKSLAPFVEDEGWQVALLGRAGEGYLRAWVWEEEKGVQWGVEVADSPGERAGITLVEGRAATLEEAKALALKRGEALLSLLKALE